MTVTPVRAIAFVGPPLVGKKVQSTRLSATLNCPRIQMSDLLRSHMDRRVRALVDRGEYVPDDIATSTFTEEIQRTSLTKGIVLDGYPRTEQQLLTFMKMMRDRHCSPLFIFLLLTRDECRARLKFREGERRADDVLDVLNMRLEDYATHAKRMWRYLHLEHQDKVLTVNGSGTIEEVSQLIEKKLGLPARADIGAITSPS